jgi:hypothetical protein
MRLSDRLRAIKDYGNCLGICLSPFPTKARHYIFYCNVSRLSTTATGAPYKLKSIVSTSSSSFQ